MPCASVRELPLDRQILAFPHRLLEAIRKLGISPFEDCRKLGRTLEARQVEIGRMWRFSRSNGITEGFHRKMKLIQRRAFGFRNFENYRRRVRALCA
jgi:transposase